MCMFQFKNRKSKKELVAHSKKSNGGKIIFNPGSQTGAKKSDYKFNDIAVNIPGSNFQVTIKAEESKDFNVTDNTIMYHALNTISQEYGKDVIAIPDMYVTFKQGTSGMTCDKTYEEIVNYGGRVIPVYETEDFGKFNGEFGLLDKDTTVICSKLDFDYALLGSERISTFSDDLIISFHIIVPEYEINLISVIAYNKDNIVYTPSVVAKSRTNYHLMTYNDGEFNVELVKTKSNANKDIITVDTSAVNYFIDKLSKVFNEYVPDFRETSRYNIDINRLGTFLGGFCLLGLGRFSVDVTYDENDGLYHIPLIRDTIPVKSDIPSGYGQGLYAVYKTDDGLTNVYIDVTFTKDENGVFHFNGYHSNIPEILGSQSYDVTFDVDIDMTWGETATVNIISSESPIINATNVGRLNIGEITTQGIEQSWVFDRIAGATVLDSDVDYGEYGTALAGSVQYSFDLAIKYKIVFSEQDIREAVYDLVIFSNGEENNLEWKYALVSRSPWL